jgi:hypothetical protein
VPTGVPSWLTAVRAELAEKAKLKKSLWRKKVGRRNQLAYLRKRRNGSA